MGSTASEVYVPQTTWSINYKLQVYMVDFFWSALFAILFPVPITVPGIHWLLKNMFGGKNLITFSFDATLIIHLND